ncbi:ATP-dependent DNA helicase chl1 [Coemansia spiralis]|uniref:ATP-dependent DNA helicase CHL1 n=2 Tax=Coemansia TaxID=4863 RepID=A0A9W8G8I8_9FUNG|nr:ATP-dependent DNA helicase chl1 [Coemansia umbellata]KAJ2621496.1 ATP-dependent DNA helicase chl1 [Coemansia sp. RSA 1358]KAJ2677172.1 ATP-dependent DNA helicase chl1 [Coemansia spiralis]
MQAPKSADEFSFPMKPYDIQLQFMQRLFETIENGQFAIFESPTGTGKSLSIICGALTWLRMDIERAKDLSKTAESSIQNSDDCPDWVLAFEKRRLAEEAKSDDDSVLEKYKRWVNKIRRKEAMERKANKAAIRLCPNTSETKRNALNKRKLDMESVDDLNDDDSAILVDAYYSDGEGAQNADDGEVQYSKEVQRLLKQRAANKPYYDSDDSETGDREASGKEIPQEPIVTKIFYASRTHSQLQQFVREIKRTAFVSRDRIKCITLGSRKQLCISSVREHCHSVHSLNEKCLEMQQSKKSKRCTFLPMQMTPMFDFKDAVGDKIMDIEELAKEGQQLSVCPYYGSRASVNSAQVVALPYNMLLSKSARESMGISLDGNIVIIDEAHNLVDTILSIHSIVLDWKTTKALLDMMQMYLSKYWRRLKGNNTVYIRQTIALLKALNKFMQASAVGKEKQETTVMSVNEFLQKAHADHINVYKIDRYLRESKIGRKLNMFAENRKSADQSSKREKTNSGEKASSNTGPAVAPATAVSTFESFMECIGSPNRTGARLVVSVQPVSSSPSPNGIMDDAVVELKYLLLDPSEAFGEICKDARAVILAGGTMKPAKDVVEQLLPVKPDSDESKTKIRDLNNAQLFSWNHVVSASHVCVQVIDKGPTGVPLKFALQDQSDMAKLREVGNALAALCNVVPGGVVVFFPSYALLNKMYSEWTKTGIVARISQRKPVFVESSSAAQPQKFLTHYTLQVRKPGSAGAVLLSVVGGRLSEGINFSDDLGRAVVMVGVPYPNLASPELVERLAYYENGGAGSASDGGFKMGPRGRELYESLCMRAVNQSIGRAIRHQRDYAAIVFLDCRYAEPRIASKLPAWITGGESNGGTVACKSFGPALATLASFFKRDFNLD